MKFFKYLFAGATVGILLISCAKQSRNDSDINEAGFHLISQAKAYDMMQNQKVVVLDVREKEEYVEGYIKNSVLLPVGTIETDVQDVIPNKDEVILVYCKSGNRSKIASRTLAELGYRNIYEFGGINTWEYEIVK